MKTIVQLVTELKTYFLGKDTAARQAVEANIAPVETDASAASQGYSAGAQLFLNDVLYDVIAPINANDALVVGTNIQAADDLSTQIAGAENGLANEAATRSAMGAKNILPFDLDEIKALNTAGTWASNVYSYRGVDFTVNPDGTILADGQATGGNASIKVFAATSSYEMLGKNVILNGCPSGGSATTYRIQAYRMGSADGSSGTYFDDGEGTIAFDALNNGSGTVGSFAVAVYENYDADNLLFKPMVRLSTDSNSDYQPYAKTNKELTDETSALNSALSNKLEKVIISDISQIPNNDIKDLEDGVYTIILGVLTNPNLLNAPPISSGVQLLITTASSGFRYFNCLPYNNGLPTYFGGLEPNGVIIGWRPVVVTSNPNLLDNPWFTVNQRGQSSYTTTNDYSVDRWRLSSKLASVVVNSDGSLNVTAQAIGTGESGEFHQRIDNAVMEKLDGKILTLSALIGDTIYQVSGVYNYNENSTPLSLEIETGVMLQIRNIPTNASRAIARFLFTAGGSEKTISNIKALKLELGSVSTLAMDTAPNYATELLKCQRYFQRIKFYGTGKLIGFSFANANKTAVWTMLPIATPMRTTPTSISVSDLTKIKITSNASWTGSQVPTSLSFHNLEGVNFHLTWIVTNDFTAGEGVNVQSTDDVYIDLNADL